MRHRFVRTMVALGILATSATVVAFDAPETAVAPSAPSSVQSASLSGVDPAMLSSRSWAALFALATAVGGAGLVAQRRQRLFDLERRRS